MKKILVPTDFSDCAGFAADAAVRMSIRFGAEVIFYTRIPGDETEAPVETDKPETLPMSISGRFQDLLNTFENPPLRYSFVYSSQDLIGGVLSYAEAQSVDLIVMGSSGAGGLKELVWGSNAQRMVNQSTKPVLVIKHPVENIEFSDIVFASNFYREVMEPFKDIIRLAQIFGSTLHLVHVTTKDTDDVEEYLAKEKMAKFSALIEKRVPHTVHFFGDIDTRHGVEHFARDNQHDLIALVSHGEGFFKKILKGGSVTEGLVNRVEMPILTVRAVPIESMA
ncbi:MAG: universal stress protein [Bacteroidia bacterium]